MKLVKILAVGIFLLGAVWGAKAQQPPAAQPGAKPAQPQAPAQPPPPTPDPGYSYNPDGRRDPFVSLVGRGETGSGPGMPRPSGVAGLLIGEVNVKGVLRDREGFLALLQAPDNKTYTVRVGDKLFDGTVKSINQEKVVFSQNVNDPLSLVKQREVPKPVRPGEGRG
jgi:type IV pilus assembly protein PilP